MKNRMRDIVRRVVDRLARDPLPVRLVYMIGVSAVIGIAPMGIARIAAQEYAMAALDILILLSILSSAAYCWSTGRVRAASIAMGATAVTGSLAIIGMRGSESLYWIYPTLISTFFIMPPRVALAIGIAAVPAAVIIASPSLSGMALGNLLITLTLVELFGYVFSVQMNARHGRLTELASSDALTNLGNRRALDHAFGEDRRVYANGAALLVIDLDNFKRINDRYGHEAGDRLLRRCAGVLRDALRSADRVFRYGGEEFVVLLPHTRLAQAAALAEDLRRAINETLSGECGEITVSIGYAELTEQETWHACMTRADAALYQAKRGGRNRISPAKAPAEAALPEREFDHA